MYLHHAFLLVTILVLATLFVGARGDAIVTGTVYCDQCKDGAISFLDYPLYGVKVAVTCEVSSGIATMTNSDTTNMFGSYTVRFNGLSLSNADTRNCHAQISDFGQGSRNCGALSGPARPLRLMMNMFGMEIYTVDALISQPATPSSFCPKSASPFSRPVSPSSPAIPVNPVPPPAIFRPVNPGTPSNPPPSIVTPVSPVTPSNPPTVRLPPNPYLRPPNPTTPRNPVTPPSPPTVKLPPIPYFKSAACPYQQWTMPEHSCYWKVVGPDTKVAVAFGLIAARRYGTDITLRQGLEGRGDVYRTLLREGTTALLNSYNSMYYGYPTLSVIGYMNSALLGSPRRALFMALRFRRANSGFGTVRCNFTPCK